MNGSFNSQILVDKLAKLNNTQQSIETLSHWCIFHRNKAKQVVDTWSQQFHCAAKGRRVSFLYLANDILQNSRRKGVEFIAEFWRVLPGALMDVMNHGDDSGRNAALRLVDIWEERKVFGSRGQTLKEDLLGKNSENRNKDAKEIVHKLKNSGGEMLEKLSSSYDHLYNLPMDEDSLYSKCQIAVNFVDKTEREFANKSFSGDKNSLETQHRVLGECIENLKAAKLSRNNLINCLREALVEQELKIQQIDNQLQVAHSRFDQASKLLGCDTTPTNQTLNLEPETLIPSQTLTANQTLTLTTAPEAAPSEDVKSAAAAVAAKLAASTCSAQMLSLVFSSLASSETQNLNSKTLNPSETLTQNSSSETLTLNPSPPEPKRPKLGTSYIPPLPQFRPEPVPPPPAFPPSPTKENGTCISTGTSMGTGTEITLPVQGGMVGVPGAMSVMGNMGGMVPFGYGNSGPMFMPPMLVPPPFMGGPGPYQGFHAPTPPPSFAPTLPPLSRP